ncbi:MAG: hypothetical protein ACYCZB_07275 [Acidiphilium sp.]
MSSEPRGIAPGAAGTAGATDGIGCVGAGRPGAIRKGGVDRLLGPIGAAKAESETAAIMSRRITSIN